jgi:hypothetical protein
MTNWKSTIRIGDLHAAFQNNEITIQELGRRVAERCKLNKFIDRELEDDLGSWHICDAIDALGAGVEDVHEYDDCLKALYDFGDDDHMIWIDTISKDL